MKHYNNLLEIITRNNKLLQEHELKYHQLLEEKTTDSSELLEIETKRRNVRNKYSTEISDYIIQNISSLRTKDVAILDFVPPRVWANVTAKARLVAQAIYQGIDLIRENIII